MAPSSDILFLLLLPVAAALTTPGEKSALLPFCHGPSDLVVSLLIVAVVFVCACPRRRPTQEDDKIYMNMPGRG
uniref:Hematopoietic cell signal transducer n=1 Tax=Panthera tigris altaica TaxID=74533 RepID=A0A8C9K6Q7_PANTA